jgi:hypothetical protein
MYRIRKTRHKKFPYTERALRLLLTHIRNNEEFKHLSALGHEEQFVQEIANLMGWGVKKGAAEYE